MITVGFTLIGRGNWSGGETYQRNMFGMISDLLSDTVRIKLFLSPAQSEKLGGSLDRFLDGPPVVDPRVAGAGEGVRALGAVVTGKDAALQELVLQHGVDVMFETAQWFGNSFAVPVVSWIPDFQHRHLKHLFPFRTWLRRDTGFRMQTSAHRIVMLSSEDGRTDCETYFPRCKGRTRVVRFSIDLDPGAVHARVGEVRKRYALPERFIYLPNQFWTHKNHLRVVEALSLLSADGRLANLPPVLMTGRKDDPRDPDHFARVEARARELCVESHFRHLGLIPYEDVFALNAAADRLLNPALFEGWSTTVEEAKVLGTPMILSDIPLHREQAPEADFFAPNSAKALADVIAKTFVEGPRAVTDVVALQAAQKQRRLEHADALLGTFEAALKLHGRGKYRTKHR